MNTVEDAADFYRNHDFPDDLIYEEVMPDDVWQTPERRYSAAYTEILARYGDFPKQVADFFAAAQTALSSLSDGFNQRIGRHYWAEESRQLIKVITSLTDFNAAIEFESGNSLITNPPEFLDNLIGYLDFLQQSNGSEIPDSTQNLDVFALRKSQIFKLNKPLPTEQFDDSKKRDLQLIGTGSYATVFKFHDRDTGEWLALKRANKDLSEEEKERFAREFEFLKKTQSQYVISVYLYERAAEQ